MRDSDAGRKNNTHTYIYIIWNILGISSTMGIIMGI
jgi:hypothetical protein